MNERRLSTLYAGKKRLYEGQLVSINRSKEPYIVSFDNGEATKTQPCWRFKCTDSETGLVPAVLNNYPQCVSLWKEKRIER